MTDRRNTIAFVAGMKGSGKSQLLAEMFVPAHPRVISIDVTAETLERTPTAVDVYGMAELCDFLDAAAEWEHWHVAAILPRACIPQLAALLAPRVESADALSYSREVGGIAIECGESYHIAPNKGTAVEVEDALCLARHHQLSWLLATQRPASCSRILSSQADYLVAFMQSEPLDIVYWSKAISNAAGAHIQSLELHEFVFYRRGDPHYYVCGADRRPRGVYKLNGENLRGGTDEPVTHERRRTSVV